MTSKNLFFNLIRENLKRRIFCIASAMLTFFFLLPVATVMKLSSLTKIAGRTDIEMLLASNKESFLGSLCGASSGIVVSTCILALVLAIHGFSYLFSKSKLDMYHALPVKREKLFCSVFLNGIFIYMCAYAFHLILSLIISSIYGLFSVLLVSVAWKVMMVHFSFFLVIYSIVVLAVVLTGNLITAILGSLVFLFYAPCFYQVICFYREMFFFTLDRKEWFHNLHTKISPLLLYNSTWVYSDLLEFSWKILLQVVAAIVFAVISAAIYKRYPSEAAGRSMAFVSSKRVIKFFLWFSFLWEVECFFNP